MSAPSYRIGPDDRIHMGGKTYRLHEQTKSGYVFEVVGQPGCHETLTTAEFAAAVEGGGVRIERGSSPGRAAARLSAGVDHLRGLPATEIRGILRRVEWVTRFLGLEKAGEAKRSDASMAAAITRVHQEIEASVAVENERARPRERVNSPPPKDGSDQKVKKPSVKTLRRWIASFLGGDLSSLALRYRYRRSGNREPRLDPQVRALLAEAARGYQSIQRPTRAACLVTLRGSILELNRERAGRGLAPLRCPSKRLLEEEIASLDKFQTHVARHGEQKALTKYGPLGAGLDVTWAGERVEMDEWLIHAQTLLERAGLWERLDATWRETAERHRLWACVALDAASRVTLGVSFANTGNTIENAIACLAMVVSDKSRLAAWAGAVSRWDMACTPDEVVTDGGPGFASAEFRAVVEDLLGRPSIPPGAVPHLRGRVERLFLTTEQQLMPLIPGRTFPNPWERGDYDAEARAAILDTVLRKLVVIYLVDVYHLTPHAGLKGAMPLARWDALVETHGVSPPPDAETRRNVLGARLLRTIGRHGVRVLGLSYTSKAVQEHFRKNGSHDAIVCVDPADLGHVSVVIDGGFYTCACVQKGMRGVPLDVWVAAEADLRRRYAAEAKLSEHIVLDAIARIKAIVAEAETLFGLGGTCPTEKELNRLESLMAISFPPPPDEDEPPPRDIRAEAIPRGTPVEPYAVMGKALGNEVEPDLPFEHEDPAADGRGVRSGSGAGVEAGKDADRDAADTAVDPSATRDVDAPPDADLNQASDEPFYDFEDDDDDEPGGDL